MFLIMAHIQILLRNIRLGLKLLTLTNAQAYQAVAKKGFVEPAPNFNKSIFSGWDEEMILSVSSPPVKWCLHKRFSEHNVAVAGNHDYKS